MVIENFKDESHLTDEDRRRDTLAVLMVMGVVLLLVVAFAAGNYAGTMEASQHCATEVSR